jgi:hypothetical protein
VVGKKQQIVDKTAQTSGLFVADATHDSAAGSREGILLAWMAEKGEFIEQQGDAYGRESKYNWRV